MGRRFKRYLDGKKDEKAVYDALNRKEKDAERAKWAEKQFDDYIETHRKTKEKSHLDRTEGVYMNIDAMIQAEGGHQSARVVKGGAKYAIKCIQKGGKWVVYNDMSERLEFRYIKRKRIEDSVTRWTVGARGGNNRRRPATVRSPSSAPSSTAPPSPSS